MGALPDRPPNSIRIARRAIDGLPNVAIIGEILQFETVSRWAFPIRLSAHVNTTGSVPATTDWYVVITEQFPKGPLKLYPSKIGGITATYQHQMNNAEGLPDLLWRRGELCLTSDIKSLGIPGIDAEPVEASARMIWNIQRARKWLEDCSNGVLTKPGDPFELPDFHASRAYTFAYIGVRPDTGLGGTQNGVAVCRLADNNWVSLTELQSAELKSIMKFKWGEHVRGLARENLAIWVRLDGVPLIGPWGAPMTWHELQTACLERGVDVMAVLKSNASRIRDGLVHLLILGIPIPEIVGGPIAKIHWQAVEIPVLSHRKTPGIRNKERSLWSRDVAEVLKGELAWVESEDWGSSEMTARGRLPDSFTQRTVTVIGAGAIGMIVAESLARSGCSRICIIDQDEVKAGNLCRHLLTLKDVGANKATAAASRLSLAAPTVEVSPIPNIFSSLMIDLESPQLIIDCTGSDDVADELGRVEQRTGNVFVSVSISFGAKQLFLYAQREKFDASKFRDQLRPLLQKSFREEGSRLLPREGVGCWHPVFPARVDQVWMLGAFAIGVLASSFEHIPAEGVLRCFQEMKVDGVLVGIGEVEPVAIEAAVPNK